MKKFLIIFGIFCGLVPRMSFCAVDNCENKISYDGTKGTNYSRDYFCYLESDLTTWQCLHASDDGDGCVHETIVCIIGQYVKAAGKNPASANKARVANRNCRWSNTDGVDSWDQYGKNGTDIVPDCDDPRWKSGTGKSHEAFINIDTQEIMNNGAEYVIFKPVNGKATKGNICIGFICDDASHQKPNSDGSCTGSDPQPQQTTNTHPILQRYLDKLN